MSFIPVAINEERINFNTKEKVVVVNTATNPETGERFVIYNSTTNDDTRSLWVQPICDFICIFKSVPSGEDSTNAS